MVQLFPIIYNIISILSKQQNQELRKFVGLVQLHNKNSLENSDNIGQGSLIYIYKLQIFSAALKVLTENVHERIILQMNYLLLQKGLVRVLCQAHLYGFTEDSAKFVLYLRLILIKR